MSESAHGRATLHATVARGAGTLITCTMTGVAPTGEAADERGSADIAES